MAFFYYIHDHAGSEHIHSRSHRHARDVGGQRLEVVEGGGGVPNHEVDRDEEAAEDDTKGPGDDGQEDILLEEDGVPGPPATSVIYAPSTNHRSWNKVIFLRFLKPSGAL